MRGEERSHLPSWRQWSRIMRSLLHWQKGETSRPNWTEGMNCQVRKYIWEPVCSLLLFPRAIGSAISASFLPSSFRPSTPFLPLYQTFPSSTHLSFGRSTSRLSGSKTSDVDTCSLQETLVVPSVQQSKDTIIIGPARHPPAYV